MDLSSPIPLTNSTWGNCELVRIEGTDWIIRILSNGKLYRFPPGTRAAFKRVEPVSAAGDVEANGKPQRTNGDGLSLKTLEVTASKAESSLATVRHSLLGLGELLRVEVTDWIVRYHATGKTYRYPPFGRALFTVVEDRTPSRLFSVSLPNDSITPSPDSAVQSEPHIKKSVTADLPQPQVQADQPFHQEAEIQADILSLCDESSPTASSTSGTGKDRLCGSEEDARSVSASDIEIQQSAPDVLASRPRQLCMRIIESIRNGLPPAHIGARELAVGFKEISRHITNLLDDVRSDGGRAMIIKGQYGQGKTFALKFLEEHALEQNFAVVRTEIDATENKLNKPHHIYRDLLSHLRVPSGGSPGRGALSDLVGRVVSQLTAATARIPNDRDRQLARYLILRKFTGSIPLSWLLSDPDVLEKPLLLGLLACDPSARPADARACHCDRGTGSHWPAFSAATQGDFASFLLSSLGRLCRYAGLNGLIIVMDEMEKWQDLNWKEQSHAGNLLGGLIWGATAELGKRGYSDHPRSMGHSGRGRYSFTTPERNHVGIAIAMTPRGESDPISLWHQYGILEIATLPELSERRVIEYSERMAETYAKAFDLPSPTADEIQTISSQAIDVWRRRGDRTTRFAVQAVIGAYDNWRDAHRDSTSSAE